MSMSKTRGGFVASLVGGRFIPAVVGLLPGLLTSWPAFAEAPTAQPVTVVRGALSKDMVRNTILPHIGEVRRCVDSGLTAELQLGGRLTVNFKINASGAVASARIEPSPLRDPHIERCLLAHLKSWAFPKAPGGVTKVIYAFELFATSDEVSGEP